MEWHKQREEEIEERRQVDHMEQYEQIAQRKPVTAEKLKSILRTSAEEFRVLAR